MKKLTSYVLPLAALLFTASCTDSNYDLSDIDTNSRFNVSGLTVPVNMDSVKLDLMLDIADDSDIKTDAEGNYYFQKDGDFKSKEITVEKIVLTKPDVDVTGNVSISIDLPDNIKDFLGNPQFRNFPIKSLLNTPEAKNLGLTEETPLLNLDFDKESAVGEVKLNAGGIDKSVKVIDRLGFDATDLSITMKVSGLSGVLKPFSIKGLKLYMPKGFDATAKGEDYNYDPANGILKPNSDDLNLNNFSADLSLSVNGIDYAQLAEGNKVFDADKHEFNYTKKCSAEGKAELKVKDLCDDITYARIESLLQSGASYTCSIKFEKAITISTFNGKIDYNITGINIEPVTISNVPDILKESGTNIDLRNPQIYLDITNSLHAYGVKVNSALEIKGNTDILATLNISDKEENKLLKAVSEENLYKSGYDLEKVPELGGVVSSPESGQTFPEKLYINVVDPKVAEDAVIKNFPLGSPLPGVDGKWEFYTRLSLTNNTKIKYTKEWTDWGKEDLDGLTVNKATINVTLQKDVKLDADEIEFILKGTKGELRGRTKLTGDEVQDKTIELTGEAVSGITGGKLNVLLNGMGADLNKNQDIKISNLKVTVDGYYDRKL